MFGFGYIIALHHPKVMASADLTINATMAGLYLLACVALALLAWNPRKRSS